MCACTPNSVRLDVVPDVNFTLHKYNSSIKQNVRIKQLFRLKKYHCLQTNIYIYIYHRQFGVYRNNSQGTLWYVAYLDRRQVPTALGHLYNIHTVPINYKNEMYIYVSDECLVNFLLL